MANWNFPLNHDFGQSEGLNIHGIDFFRADPFKHLAREIIQNSLDAKNKNINAPVLVKFTHHRIPTDNLPGKDELRDRFDLCALDEEMSQIDKNFFKKGIQILKEKNIDILKVSDYRTTGLRGVNNNKQEWKRLITKGGESNKGSGAGGSYGIGKNAPFACSLLNTVYYSTFNVNKEKGFQGVSKLASHFIEGKETRGTGYFRESEGLPITDVNKISTLFQRDEPGTDVIIAGLKTPEDWEKKVIKAVLDNFFVAIQEGKLEIIINGDRINKNNLGDLIKKNISSEDKDYLTNEFYEALNNEPIVIPFENLGELEFYFKEDPNYSRRVAMVRETGMKIFHLDRFPTGFYFSGVMIARGNDLNEFLRQTEPPTHDDWKADIYEDSNKANKNIKNLKKKIRDKVKELSRVDEKESVDIEGLTDFLPDLKDEGNPFSESNNISNETNDKPRKVKVNIRKERGRLTGELSTSQKRINRLTSGTQVPNSSKAKQPNSEPKVPVKIDRIRARSTQEEGTYKVTIFPSSNGIGHVQIKVVGEDARTYNEPFQKIIEQDSNKGLKVKNDKIGPVIFEKSVSKSFFITLQNNMRCSLEVSVT